MLRLLFLSSFFFAACASTWKVKDIPYVDRTWHHCDMEHDGPEFVGRGWCYQSQECKKRAIIRTEKCRPLRLYCSYDDLLCYGKYRLNQKVLSPRRK